MDVQARSVVHSAMGDESRLRLVDLLVDDDLTVHELGSALELPGNLLAHHLNVLEGAGLIVRRESEGDRRKRYVNLQRDVLDTLIPSGDTFSGSVVFVCSHNSARSQYAAAYWYAATGEVALSAGSHPSPHVHPTSIRVAAERGVDLSAAVPRGYESITSIPDLVISVCDRAREEPLPEAKDRRHWSIPDPVLVGNVAAFRSAFTDVERRVDQLIS